MNLSMDTTLQPPRLSAYGRQSATPSPVNRMMAAFAVDFREGVDINLGVGYVNERTIPRELVAEALTQVFANPQRYRNALNYGGPQGSPNLIAALRNYYRKYQPSGVTGELLAAKEIVIGANGASALLEGLADCLAPGIVITTDPHYYIYGNLLERKGFSVVTVPEDRDGVRTDLLRAKLAQLNLQAVSFFYFVTVSNPTCVIMSGERRREVAAIAGELAQHLGRTVPVIFDAAYETLIHDPALAPPPSGLLFDPADAVYELNTFAKVLAPGLRIGYMIGPDGPLLRALIQKNSDAGFSAPLMNQEITAYIVEHCLRPQLERVNQGYRDKARAVQGWLQQQLGSELEHTAGGQAGFYFYLTFRTVETHEQSRFFRFLTRTTGEPAIDGGSERPARVLYIPGEYCVHPRGDLVAPGRRQLRLSYGYEELPALERAIALMRDACAYARS
ncbi:MAG TPA: PLP-dependent aminotransferase family protein [bacterium]|nr:PLP-dependent aminotransferase family protein [bacterium]